MSYQALLFCPDEKTARVVTQVLTELDFTVEPCNEPFAAVKKLMAQHFDAVVVDSDNEQNATLLFKSARNSNTNSSSLAVAVVEGQAGVAKAFRIGANLVLTKPINIEQSKGTLRVARGLLRKGMEAAKPNAIPMSQSTPAPVAPRATESAVPPKSAFGSLNSVKAPATEISVPAASQLEVEKEPEPQLEPTEMALLESMPDATAQSLPGSPAGNNKDFPWQPPSKPLAEPMASALRRAAEVAGQKIETPASKSESMSSAPSVKAESRPLAQETPWGSAAAAPAPAKEKVRSVTPSTEPDLDVIATAPAPAKKTRNMASQAPAFIERPVEAPSFSSLEDARDETTTGSSKKTLPLAVAIVLLVAACGYFGWTKFHLGGPAPVSAPQPSASVPAPTPAPPAQASTTVTAPAVTAPIGTDNSPSASMEVTPGVKPSAAVPKDSSPKDEGTSGSANKSVQTSKTVEPVIVRTESPKPATHKLVEEAVAPPELGSVGGESSSRAISGIVDSTPVSVPQQAPQMLRVSQGVSQGLLLKRVQPVYPAQALQVRLQGPVSMQATISKEGNISNVKVLSGDTILARAAVEAVRQWKYKPYYLNGEPVEIQTQVTVNFKLP